MRINNSCQSLGNDERSQKNGMKDKIGTGKKKNICTN